MTSSLISLLLAMTMAQAAPGTEPEPDFDAFREAFRIDAVAAGIDPGLYDREMATAMPREIVLQRNDNQPEFSQPVWAYVDRAISEASIAAGRENFAAEHALLEKIEDAYGVDAEVMVAIWGRESAYGRIMGDIDVLSALGTLAYTGRRQEFGRRQLIAALMILQRGEAERAELKGSWAGAMGQTQFIPTTYLSYAVDHDGDGDKDIWADRGDVFASTANYLSRSGWQRDLAWGVEVRLPDGFDYAQANLRVRKTVGDWLVAGVEGAGVPVSDALDLNARVSVIVPAGAAGPAFMVTENFRAILAYNNSTSYALGVGMLADAVAGGAPALVRDWPRGDRPLSLEERKALQQALADKGYAPGPVDGIVGGGTRRALRAWQRDQGLPADGYASAAVLARLLDA